MGFKMNRPADVVVTTDAKGAQISPAPPREYADTRTDAERIIEARQKGLQHSRDSQSANFGQPYPPQYFIDYVGPDTSAWAASRLDFLAQLVKTPLIGPTEGFVWSYRYERRAGVFHFGSGVDIAIQAVRDAYVARIAGLGLSEVLLEEWMSTIHTLEEDIRWGAMEWDERMATFRKAETGQGNES
jgi:hypothetical protein